MKIYILYSIISSILLYMSGCGESSVTGSDDVSIIKNTEFSIIEKTPGTNTLTVTGTVKNTGKSKITPIWYIEGDFYSDNTYTFKLGGDSYQFNYSLAKGETTQWTLNFSSSQYNESDYPDFSVKNLRAYYK